MISSLFLLFVFIYEFEFWNHSSKVISHPHPQNNDVRDGYRCLIHKFNLNATDELYDREKEFKGAKIELI